MKKWLVNITDEQYDWIKKTGAEVGLKGSTVVREAIGRAMNKDSKELLSDLIEAQAKEKLDALMEQRRSIEEQIRNVRSKTKVTA